MSKFNRYLPENYFNETNELKTYQHLYLHHESYTRGFIAKNRYPFGLKTTRYAGRFGNGVKVLYNTTSTQYANCEYWVYDYEKYGPEDMEGFFLPDWMRCNSMWLASSTKKTELCVELKNLSTSTEAHEDTIEVRVNVDVADLPFDNIQKVYLKWGKEFLARDGVCKSELNSICEVIADISDTLDVRQRNFRMKRGIERFMAAFGKARACEMISYVMILGKNLPAK